MKKIAVLAFALAAAGACAPAMAYESGAFIRGEAGNSQFDVDSDLASEEADDTSFGVRGGYYFTPYVAVEGFYTRYGQDESDGAELTFDGYGVGVVGKYNFGAGGEEFYIAGRAGIAQVKTEFRVVGLGSAEDTDSTFYIGVGGGYDFTPNFGVGLSYDVVHGDFDYEPYEIGVDARTLTLGLEYRF